MKRHQEVGRGMRRDRSPARWIAALVLAGAGVAAGGAAAAQDLTQVDRQRMYHEVKPAIVFVATQTEAQIQINLGDEVINGSMVMHGGGSGFLVTPDGYLVTNGHVVAQYHDQNEEQMKLELLYRFLGENYLPQVAASLGRELTQAELAQFIPQLVQRAQVGLVRQLRVVLQNGTSFPAEVKQYSPAMSPFAGRVSFPGVSLPTGKDVAILKIEGRDLPTVALGNSSSLVAGDDVHVGGYPGAVMSFSQLGDRTRLDPSFTRGGVSGLRAAVAGNEVVQIDAAVTQGNSGGPIFNNRGEVVGIATMGATQQTPMGDQVNVQGFNFAVPTSTIQEFIRAEGLQPSVAGLFNQSWNAALDAYYGERWSEAVNAFDEVLRVQADLPDALALRSTAMTRRGTETEAAGVASDPVTPWMMVVLVGLGLTLVAASFFLRRGTTAAASGAGSAQGRVPAGGGQGGALTGGPTLQALPARGTLLVVKDGPLQGNRFPIPSSGIKIGRDPEACQVVLNENATSREHAVVVPMEGGKAQLRNLSGTNPTFVNGRPVQEAMLAPGDRIRIAGSTLSFEQE